VGWTQAELAARANVEPNYLGAIEIGRRSRGPSFGIVLELARALDVEVGDLVGSASKQLSPASFEAARLIEAMPAGLRGRILPLLRALVPQRSKSPTSNAEMDKEAFSASSTSRRKTRREGTR
jgi:transcriptional regulator with XRE-family HTH domain